MEKTIARISSVAVTFIVFWLVQLPVLAAPRPLPQAAAQAGQSRQSGFLGTVESIHGTELTIKNQSGAVVEVRVAPDARVLRIEPGQKSLQSAVRFPISGIAVGDRVLARGTTAAGGKQLNATLVVAIKKADILEKQAQEREAWEQHGVSGLVESVNPAAETVTLKRTGHPPLVIEVSSKTVLRRYAPGSAQFEKAEPAPFSSIKAGDELRALGAPVTGGKADHFAATEIVSGTFRNIAGLILSIDQSTSTMTVADIESRRPVAVKIASSTVMKKLSSPVARRIAAELTRSTMKSKKESFHPQPGINIHQTLAQAPEVPLSSFNKGEDVMLVATAAAENAPVTAVTLIGGVKPMLEASASGSQAILSSAWNLGGAPSTGSGGEEEQRQ